MGAGDSKTATPEQIAEHEAKQKAAAEAGGAAAAPAATGAPAVSSPPAVAVGDAQAEKNADDKQSPQKGAAKKVASPKASPKAAPKAEVKTPASPSAPGPLPLPPGEVKAEGGAEQQQQEKKGKGKKSEAGEKGAKEPGPRQAAAGGNKLCIKNLPDETTSDSLKVMLGAYGTVSEADAKVKEDGKCRGFGFVTMSSADEAQKAIAALHGKKVGDKELTVVVAEKRERKEETGKGKGKDKGTGKGMDKGAGKGKDDSKGKGKGKGKDLQIAQQTAQMPQTAALNPYTNAAYLQAYYQQYNNPYMQQYLNAYGYGFAQQQYMNQAQAAYAQQAQAAAYAQPYAQQQGQPSQAQAYHTPQVVSYGSLKPGEYEGSLKSVSEKHGYGFIACEDTYKKYRRDVYVNKESLPDGSKVLDRLRFTVKLLEKEKKDGDGKKKTETRPTAEQVRIVPTTGAGYTQSS